MALLPRNRFSSAKFLLLFLLAIVCCGAKIVQAAAVLEGVKPAQWRLIWTSDPSTNATLSWNTLEAGKEHRVILRRECSEEEGGEEADCKVEIVVKSQRDGRYTSTSPELFYHHVQLSKLRPATKYYVTFASDDQRSPEMFFVTAPKEDVPFSILFGADSRSGLKARQQMNKMLAKMTAESYASDRPPIVALVHGGDYVVDGRNLKLWSRWMSDHELTVGSDGRLLPIIPARGNHDGGKIFNEVFAFPPGHTNYYGTDIGPQMRMVTLNSETSTGGDQLAWLRKELTAARPKKRWLLAQYHRPVYPAVKFPSLNFIHWVPVFEQFNLDLVCEGDGHNIKRTVPIRDSQVDPTGVVYVGEGGLGVGQRTPKKNRWYINPEQAKIGQGHHVQLITFDKKTLSCQVVMLGGKVFDEYTRPPRPGAVKTAQSAN